MRDAIVTGRVTVDGLVVTRFAEPVGADTIVIVDGDVVLGAAVEPVVVLMHKPKKHVTALDDDVAPGLRRYLPGGMPRLFPVGRLDVNTEGALLFTNDGRLARRLLHPSYEVEKVYEVKLRGHLAEDDTGLAAMRAGMTIASIAYLPAGVRIIAYRTRATWVELTLREGKYREIRKMCHATGHQIVKLRRVAIGPIQIGELTPRCARVLSDSEVATLYAAVGLPCP